MRNSKLLLILMLLLIQPIFSQQKTATKNLDWKLGAQAYTFKNFTFAEALDKMNSIGLQYVEAYPGQEIGEGVEGTMHYSMDANTRGKVKKLLKSKGMQLVAYGVVSGKNEKDWIELVEFAQDMGIGVINSEPNPDDLDMVNRLAGEYNIKVALHNHPEPSIYWHPDTVLKAMDGRRNIKACADVGHWVRSGLDPVESLRKLEGHITGLHLKDLNEKSKEAHDMPWGTGVSNVKAMLRELKRQNFKGIFSVEYEHNWNNSLPEIKQSVDYFKEVEENL